ncbi:MAG: hypothetical protein NT051_06420, partial [Candidatus Micrarchaeota archaeon]|nr:hypothetical protein [Candidatus Micrarchaeota archaeon]
DWKREIMPKMKKDFARRLPMSLFGDFAPEILMGKYKDGQKTDFGNAIPEKNLVYPVIQELAYGLEVAKKRITGEW